MWSSEFKTILKRRMPGQLVIQLTDKCNALCPQCDMRVTAQFGRSTLPLDDALKAIDAAAEKGVAVVSFTGGEPLLFLDDLVVLINHANRAGIRFVRTGTNGYLFAHPAGRNWKGRVHSVAEKLARTPLRNFWISLDSALPEIHNGMRGFRELFTGIEQTIPIFHEYGLYPSANLGLNRMLGGQQTWNVGIDDNSNEESRESFYRAFRRALDDFYQRVINMGFTIVNCCYPMSKSEHECTDRHAIYAATSADRIVGFSTLERATLYRALLNTVPRFRSKIRVFSPLTSLTALYRQYSNKNNNPSNCLGGLDFFFMNARNGDVYPCGYRGNDNLGKLWQLDLQGRARQATCTKCDWECFRDPSELAGPLLESMTHPIRLIKRIRQDRDYFRLWIQDLRYYRACDYFDGRKPLNTDRLHAFSTHCEFIEHSELEQVYDGIKMN